MDSKEKYNNDADKKAAEGKKKALNGEGLEAVSDDELDEVAGGVRGYGARPQRLGLAKPGTFKLPGDVERM